MNSCVDNCENKSTGNRDEIDLKSWGNSALYKSCKWVNGGSSCDETYCRVDTPQCVADNCASYCTVNAPNKDLKGCKNNCHTNAPGTDMSLCTENCSSNAPKTDMSGCINNCSCKESCDMSSCVGENCNCYSGNCGPKNYSDIGYIIAIVIGVLFLVGIFFYQKKKRGEEEQNQHDENKPVFPVAAQPVPTQQQYAPVAAQQQYAPVAMQAPVPPQPQAPVVPVVPVPYQEADIVVNSS